MRACDLCHSAGGEVLWQNALCRVVRVDDPYYPGFLRVIVNRHVREVTDLTADERRALMEVVWAVERVVREAMEPDKMNLASLGNMTPHVHWHVIPRFADDRHFPDAVWAKAAREGLPDARRASLAQAIPARLAAVLGAG
jgi:diadenosine tetraphosphate (Ap4A) HIT family hydrolase